VRKAGHRAEGGESSRGTHKGIRGTSFRFGRETQKYFSPPKKMKTPRVSFAKAPGGGGAAWLRDMRKMSKAKRSQFRPSKCMDHLGGGEGAFRTSEYKGSISEERSYPKGERRVKEIK